MRLPELNRRVAYRRVLPVAQTLIFVALTVVGCPYIQDAVQRIQLGYHPQENRRTEAGVVGWDPSCIDASMSLSEQAAEGVNFPATLASVVFVPVARMIHLECRRADYFGHASILLFVPILWYGIGCLLDGKPLVRRGRFHLNKALVWSLVATVAIVTALATLGFALNPEFLLLQALVLAWLVLALLALIRRAKSGPALRTAPSPGR